MINATDFIEKSVYYPEIRPGYTAWLSLFPFENGDLGLAFQEIRKGANPDFVPSTLEFIHAMGLPYRFGSVVLPSTSRDLITEYVYMRSSDNGSTWRLTGRSPVRTRHYYHAAHTGDTIVRIHCRAYCGEFGDDRFVTITEHSTNGGCTWSEISRMLEGHFFYLYRLKKISGDRLVASGVLMTAFGANQPRSTLYTTSPGVIYDVQGCFFVSEDGGRTWDGPHYVLQGVNAYEFDFVELPDGRLLVVNSDVQSGKTTRQIVRHAPTGWVNEPVMAIHRGSPAAGNVSGGIIPESIVLTPEGLLVGARRTAKYACSNDLGDNWFEIGGTPDCNYQPMMVALPGGHFLTAWHKGGDSAFGEVDMYIGTHEFGLTGNLPAATELTLERDLSADGSKYINAFSARLTSAGKPIAGRKVIFRTRTVWKPDGKENTVELDDSTDVFPAITNENGVARVAFPEFDTCADIHFAYRIDVVFRPEPDDELLPSRGPSENAYAVTERRNCPAAYPVYLVHGWIMITPEIAKEYPELAKTIERLDGTQPAVTFDEIESATGDAAAAEKIIALLTSASVLIQDAPGRFHWFRAVHCGSGIVKGVKICHIEENYV